MTKSLEQIASELKSVYKYDPYSGNFYLKLSWEPKGEGENQMTKSIEAQAREYVAKFNEIDIDDVGEFGTDIHMFLAGAKSRDAEWIKVVNELKGALTKSKDTLQELNSDFGNFIYEDGSEETEQEVKDTYDHVDKTLIKADQMMKEMGMK